MRNPQNSIGNYLGRYFTAFWTNLHYFQLNLLYNLLFARFELTFSRHIHRDPTKHVSSGWLSPLGRDIPRSWHVVGKCLSLNVPKPVGKKTPNALCKKAITRTLKCIVATGRQLQPQRLLKPFYSKGTSINNSI